MWMGERKQICLYKYTINTNTHIYICVGMFICLFECLVQLYQETMRQIQKGTFFKTTRLEKMMEQLF